MGTVGISYLMSFIVKFFSSPIEAAADVIISKLLPDNIWLRTPTKGSWFFWWSASNVCAGNRFISKQLVLMK